MGEVVVVRECVFEGEAVVREVEVVVDAGFGAGVGAP